MKKITLLVLVTLASCAQEARNDAVEPTRNSEAAPLTPAAPGTPGGLPDDRTPLAEPRGPIDPKSAEGAGQIVQQFAALIEEQRYSEAAALWGNKAELQQFDSTFKSASELHMQIGKPGKPEGAAGSAYIDVPVVLYGRAGGKTFSRGGTATMRRVNDVPGSTEEQRRWRIERIALKPAA